MSPLDGRIRALAREEVAEAIQDIAETDTQRLQQQIADLAEHLHHAGATISRLEHRISVLEKAAGQTKQEQTTPARRTRRKAESDN